jgi:hypothetical protein
MRQQKQQIIFLKKIYYPWQSWANMWNPWLAHEICLDYMSIMHPRSWGWDNSINKEIQENHKVSFEKITILNDDIEKENKTKKDVNPC